MDFKQKRSAVAGKVPTTAQLVLGELAINTHDGRLFLKRDDGTESIVEFVNSGRLISAGTGLTGGGSLAANRTLTADIASQAEAEAGTVSTKLMTPERVAQAIVALAKGVGVGQTWQDVKASRSTDTSYQNTTGLPITVAVQIKSENGGYLEVSADDLSWVTVMRSSSASFTEGVVLVPPGHYYRVRGSVSFNYWSELR